MSSKFRREIICAATLLAVLAGGFATESTADSAARSSAISRGSGNCGVAGVISRKQFSRSDDWITGEVKSEILADSTSAGFTVNVYTRQGVVVLRGELADWNAIARIKSIVRNVRGVRGVDTSALQIGSI
jgi:osmotically-inducible protein OsmY